MASGQHIRRAYPLSRAIAQLVLLGIPTTVLGMYFLFYLNSYYSILDNRWLSQGLYFGVGLGCALFFYSFRFRFLTTAAVLFAVWLVAYKLIGNVAVGEFDAFFVSVRFLIFSILFSIGWIAGFGFARSRYFTIFWSVFLLAVQAVLVSRIPVVTVRAITAAFLPVIAYSAYCIYIAELIRNMSDQKKRAGGFIIGRLGGFLLLLALVLLSVFYVFRGEFQGIEKEWGGSKANYDPNGRKSERMTKENPDGTLGNKDQTQLSASLNKSKRLVFVAKLDNFLADGKTPNPLYFTSYYYTKFDTLTQTFETDSLMPGNDLFKPNPSRIPLYFARSDSSVIINAHGYLNRKVVNAEIYKTLLGPDEFVAPSTAFFCQPVPVESAYKDQFRSAYRAKMWVSDLNSAYFIYNPAGNASLDSFQQQRFRLLRRADGYTDKSITQRFMRYYTYMPHDPDYDRIGALSRDVTRGAMTTVDKMLAIRSYFLRKDEFGQPMFKYSDNPGIPGMPSANKLTYFLFQNRKGYCAYYAGATLFMLRSLGIPSRVAAGFLTVDRSSKNPGWYWFYEDQAHAWVQVFFPGYGWIDFDTTVPDFNARESPQPDGTPPMNTQQAWLVADGTVVSVDVPRKKLTMTVGKLLFHDQPYQSVSLPQIEVDASIATISSDTGAISLAALKKGMHITAASSADTLKNIKAEPTDSLGVVLGKLKKPVPVDEIKVIEPEGSTAKKNETSFRESQGFDWEQALRTALLFILAAALVLFLLPWLVWRWFLIRSAFGGVRNRTFYRYRAATLYLHLTGHPRFGGESPSQYAARVDSLLQAGLLPFTVFYQSLRYGASGGPTADIDFNKRFYRAARKHIAFNRRLSGFSRPARLFEYLKHPVTIA